MHTDERLGTFEEVASAAGGFAPILTALRGQIERLHPDALETASRKEQSVTWGFEGGKMKASYAYARPFKAHVNLGFFQGAHLPDPDGLLEGTGKSLRHVKLLNRDEALTPAIRDLIIAARDERRSVLET